ncbi:site-specific DNA-methyltransferase [Treponema sp. HNW]|uniref:DNA-methyltransferase n=1 Tax=Treponema sp. HNW TaxID=3116654 RepID=UPI003D0EEF4C
MKLNHNIEILRGDCIELLEKIPTQSVQSVITDPPYFLGMTHNGQKGTFNDLAICKPFYEKLFFEYKRILKPDGCVYFFTDWRGYAFYYPLFASLIGISNCLIWNKKSGPGIFYRFAHEFVLFYSSKPLVGKRLGLNVIDSIAAFNSGAKKTNGEKVHPTQKPVELIEKFILDSTNAGDVVLDSFMGSGTTGAACINTGRRFIGMELDEGYFNIARTRLENNLKQDS